MFKFIYSFLASKTNHYHQPTQGILASYPHSTILSLANRNSASVVYTQSPIVSIPSRNDRQSSSDMKGGNEPTIMDGKSIESYSHHSLISQYQNTESSISLSKPLNEIQSSSGVSKTKISIFLIESLLYNYPL